ncbi:MAG: ATP-binding cassette domain-containing protein [Bacteroidota bacterium]|nr:ATP-binding cassette domain-containing protein [Bacteroidota bacterium]
METETDNAPVVDIQGLSKAFNGVDVLRGVNLRIDKAENLVVLGKSGSGKSTLIKCMIGLMEPDEGSICIMGQNIAEINYDDLNKLRTKIGFLFQGGALYDSMSVSENLSFPLRHHKKHLGIEKINQLIREVLENVGLPDSGDKMPSELSGGMSKRIGLARTLILKPSIMLYDEPTTGLDTATAKEISQLILDMQRKYQISSLIITHDISCAKMTADRIVMLKEGVIVAEDTYDGLEKSKDEWIRSFFS